MWFPGSLVIIGMSCMSKMYSGMSISRRSLTIADAETASPRRAASLSISSYFRGTPSRRAMNDASARPSRDQHLMRESAGKTAQQDKGRMPDQADGSGKAAMLAS